MQAQIPHELTEDTEVRKAPSAPYPGAPGRFYMWLAAAAILAVWIVPLERLPYMCTSRTLFGVPCPTCGFGRALHALLRLDIPGSLRFHPLVLPAVVFAVGCYVVRLRLPSIWRKSCRFAAPVSILWVVLLAAVWVVRLRAGSIP